MRASTTRYLDSLLGWATPLLGRHMRLDPHRMLDDVRARTGEPLDMPAGLPVIADAAKVADLSPLGRVLLKTTVLRMLRRAAGLQRARRLRTEDLSAPLRKPLIVTGLHRTGTTTLQRLLALDPQVSYLPLWLTLADTLPDRASWRAGMRRERRFGRQAAWFWNWLNPAVEDVHPTGADLPEEELEILIASFSSPALYYRTPLHDYFDWSLTQDPTPSYEALRTTLLALQAVMPGQRWLLKCPTHLVTFGALLRCFPEADVVVTHRDPVKALPSFIHMIEVLQSLSHPQPRTPAMIERARRINRIALGELDAQRSAHEHRILDLSFPELVADPIAAVRRIYERFDYPWSEPFEHAMVQFLAEERHRTKATRPPGVEAYGLTPDEVRNEYADYVRKYLPA